MEDDEVLKPELFPLRAQKIVTTEGKPVAQTNDEATAEVIAEQLNIEEAKREEDRWSA